MPNITSVLNDQIRRIARREIKATTRSTRKASGQYRRVIAALKRQIVDLMRRLGLIEKRQPKQVVAPPEVVEKARFRAQGVKSHRAKLGLSAKDFGALVGVDGQTIYKWELGKSRPRRAQMAKLLTVRGLGKREAMARLGLSQPETTPADAGKSARKPRTRGIFKRTGTESILALLRKKGLPGAAINQAWKQEGRAGRADATLGQLVKARKLKRIKVKGQRGSLYALA